MIFGSLSEKDVQDISGILKSENIKFEVIKDEEVLRSNKDSLSNNLRYLHGPDLSNSFLAIEIDSDLSCLSEKSKEALYKYGITDQIPEEFLDKEFETAEPEHINLVKGQKKVVGVTYGLSVLLSLVIFLVSYVLSKFDVI